MEKSGSDIAVATTDLCKRYGQNIALDGTSFAVTKGSIFGIIGADGAGKTTLLKTLATLIRPDSGSASICGFNLAKQHREIRRHIGYMPENFSLYADLTVWENISFYASLFNVPITANLQVIEPVFKQLAPFKNRKAGKLSGGMKQKLALSCALIHQPELLLLDEPTRGVDPISRKEFWTILTAIKEAGITTILSTSYMDEATMCDSIGLFSDGRFLTSGTPSDIITTYPYNVVSISSKDLYSSLTTARLWEGSRICYTFGDNIHCVLRQGYSQNELAAYMNDKLNLQCSTKQIKPCIEDCFMILMNNGTNN